MLLFRAMCVPCVSVSASGVVSFFSVSFDSIIRKDC